jgi:ribosomal protein L2
LGDVGAFDPAWREDRALKFAEKQKALHSCRAFVGVVASQGLERTTLGS